MLLVLPSLSLRMPALPCTAYMAGDIVTGALPPPLAARIKLKQRLRSASSSRDSSSFSSSSEP